ncbi:MAG: malto-oligosyltrehalose trehalohydrolase [Rhodocyclaceae bacterium]
MPFGCTLDAGGVRFRLWAPGAHAVALLLDGQAPQSMAAVGDGWFECANRLAQAGSRYRFRIDNRLDVPDPASRFNPEDVHGPSEVVDPLAFDWQDEPWRGRPWHEAVLYELHVGTFSPEGTFAGVERRLDDLAALGVTAIELMPIADFPGTRNWGYDGVLPYAPDAAYGRPEDLKRLVRAAHARGLMVFLDVVYNHFGPDGNYLHAYAPAFFNPERHTPWGAAINFDGPGSRTVRDFFIHNALYWLEEYRFDGLRLDAVHAIIDDSCPDILEELAAAVHAGPGKDRHVHLVLENPENTAHYLERDPISRAPMGYDAQWNDDIHHAFHVLLTGERDGYYGDYADRPIHHLGRCLAEGFAFQGEASAYHGGAPRGERSAHLPPTAFVSFLQNHDQVGNRAFGERLSELAMPERLRAMLEILLLAPAPPLLFMGEEWGTTKRFAFFCDFDGDLARAVTEGRRREFARFAQFAKPEARQAIPDPCAAATFAAAKLDWSEREQPPHREWLNLTGRLLDIRRRHVMPLLGSENRAFGNWRTIGASGLRVCWQLAGEAELCLAANLGDLPLPGMALPETNPFYASPGLNTAEDGLPPWSVAWFLTEKHD